MIKILTYISFSIIIKPLLLKGIHEDSLKNCDIFWYIKTEKGVLGGNLKYYKHKTGTYFPQQL